MGFLRHHVVQVCTGLAVLLLLFLMASERPADAQSFPASPVYKDISSSTYDRVYASQNYLCVRHLTPTASKGKIRCWGTAGNSQFPRTWPSFNPTVPKIGALSAHTFDDVALLRSGGCGIVQSGSDAGKIWCWGLNPNGAATPPGTNGTGELTPGKYTSIAGAGETFCAVGPQQTGDYTGNVICWGSTKNGLTQPPNSTLFKNTPVSTGSPVIDVLAAGPGAFCGLAVSASKNYVQCWGTPGGLVWPGGAPGPGEIGTTSSIPDTSNQQLNPPLAVGVQTACVLTNNGDTTSPATAPSGGWFSECWDNKATANQRASAKRYGSDTGTADSFIAVSGGSNPVCGLYQTGKKLKCWPDTPLLNLKGSTDTYKALASGGAYLAMLTSANKLHLVGYPPDLLLKNLPDGYTEYKNGEVKDTNRRVAPTSAPNKAKEWGSQKFTSPPIDGTSFWKNIEGVPGGGYAIQLMLMLGTGLWTIWYFRDTPNRYYFSFGIASAIGIVLWLIGIGHWNMVVLLSFVGLGGTFVFGSRR